MRFYRQVTNRKVRICYIKETLRAFGHNEFALIPCDKREEYRKRKRNMTVIYLHTEIERTFQAPQV
jgi:hypothetical protein